MLNLESRYQQIRQTVENLRDFPEGEQAKSLALFTFEDRVARPRCFQERENGLSHSGDHLWQRQKNILSECESPSKNEMDLSGNERLGMRDWE